MTAATDNGGASHKTNRKSKRRGHSDDDDDDDAVILARLLLQIAAAGRAVAVADAAKVLDILFVFVLFAVVPAGRPLSRCAVFLVLLLYCNVKKLMRSYLRTMSFSRRMGRLKFQVFR